MRNNSLIRYIALMIVVALAAGGGWAVYKKQKVAPAAQLVRSVRVAKAAAANIAINVEYAGKIRPVVEVPVASRVPGRVLAVNADVGQEVKAGEVLFTLDRNDAEAQLSEGPDGLTGSLANPARVTNPTLAQQVLQAEAGVRQAQILYDNAKDLYDRTQKLYKEGGVPKQQMDDVELKHDNARVQLDAARDTLNLLTVQLDPTSVTAPITGVVAMRVIDVGQLLAGGIPALTVIDNRMVTVEVNVPDRIVKNVRLGQQIPVQVSALNSRTFQGAVEAVSPAADQRTQAYLVKLRIDNADRAILPGMLARVAFPAESRQNVLAVPNEAVVVENGVHYVYVVDGDKVRKKTVAAGLQGDMLTEVSGEVQVGEMVITEGQGFLSDGEKVKVAE